MVYYVSDYLVGDVGASNPIEPSPLSNDSELELAVSKSWREIRRNIRELDKNLELLVFHHGRPGNNSPMIDDAMEIHEMIPASPCCYLDPDTYSPFTGIHSFMNAEYYRDVLDILEEHEGNVPDDEFMDPVLRGLRFLLGNNLRLGPSCYKMPGVPFSGKISNFADFHGQNTLLCAAIATKDLPWDTEATDW